MLQYLVCSQLIMEISTHVPYVKRPNLTTPRHRDLVLHFLQAKLASNAKKIYDKTEKSVINDKAHSKPNFM
jgi:hypothetical protein